MFNWLYGPILITKSDKLSTFAAALAYNVVLSMVPFFVVTVVFGLEIAKRFYPGSNYSADFVHVFNGLIPVSNQIVTTRSIDAVEKASLGGLVPIGLILALYTSFNLM